MQIDLPVRRRHSISLTSLVDVVFILLFFFMLASSYQSWRSIDLSLAGSGDAPLEPGAELQVLRQLADGSLLLQDVPLDIEEIEAQVRERPQLKLVVQPGEGVDLQSTIALMDRLRRAGAQLALGRLESSP